MSTTRKTYPEGTTVRGIELVSEFPDRRDSPDPVEMIEALLDHGTWIDAAREIECGERTVRKWGEKYPEIRKAYVEGSASIGYEAEQTLVRIMRGEQIGDASKPKTRDVLNAARKLISTNHRIKDYTDAKRVIREEVEDSDELDKDIDEMDVDELLDAYNKITDND